MKTCDDAVSDSKRVILLLSPAYVTGEWPNLERVLQKSPRRNPRIIPLILEPLGDAKQLQQSLTLGHIIKYLPCITWPSIEMTAATADVKEPQDAMITSVVSRNPVANPSREDEFWNDLGLALPKISETSPDKVQADLAALEKI